MPATLRLLGDRTWYLPRRLSWFPELGIEGGRADGARERAGS